jgi:hypothetical protein
MVNLEMKNLSVFLAILLMILMYYTPPSLKDLANSFLGKLFLLIILSYFALFCDLACAVIFSMIIIVLLHDIREQFVGGGFADVINKTVSNADNAESKMDESKSSDGKDGFKESHEHDDDEGNDGFKGKKDKKKKEGFVGENQMKIVNEKLRKYLGFSITDLDRQIKTSSEKNSQEATKDLI